MINKTILLVLILSVGLLISCGDNSTGTDPKPEEPEETEEPAITTGTLEVTVITEGESPDEDGYELAVDGNSKIADVDDTITFSELEEGSYEVEMSGVAENCSVDGDNPVSVDITAEETTTTTIEITCKLVLKDKIVFGSDRDGSFDIYSMDRDGNNIQQLTDHMEYDGEPVISNDGTRIVFESTRNSDDTNLFIMDADGSNIQQITFTDALTYGFSWSPNDEFIAYNDRRTGSNEIYIIRPDGTEEEQLTSDPSVEISSPDWTPDGEKILFAKGYSEIYIMDKEGANPQPLTDYSVYSGSPAVSPDGSKIAFRSNLDGDFKLYIMNIDGTDRNQLTENTPNDFSPSWSPDGSEIVFGSTRDGNDEIYKIKADGSEAPINLTNNSAYDERPSWSPVE